MPNIKRLFIGSLLVSMLSGCSLFLGEAEVSMDPEPVVFDAQKRLDVVWSSNVGGDLGYRYHQFSPAISGDFIYAASEDGVVKAFNKATGDVLWTYKTDDQIFSGVGAGDQHLAVVLRAGTLIVLNDDGTEAWQASLDGEVITQPQIQFGLVVVQQANGVVRAFDVRTGVDVWRYDSQLPSLTLRGNAAPLVLSDVTFAALDNGKLIAIDNASGELVFDRLLIQPAGRTEIQRLVDIDGQPAIQNGVLYLASAADTVLAMSLSDGLVLWRRNLASYQSVALGLSKVYVASDDGLVHALDQVSGTNVWMQSQLKYRSLTAPYTWQTSVVTTDTEGVVYVMSQQDGQLLAMTKPATDGLGGQLVGDSNSLFVLSNSGKLTAYKLLDVK